jgi:hypothetical protein
MTGKKLTPLDREAASEILLKVYSKFFDAHKHLKEGLL